MYYGRRASFGVIMFKMDRDNRGKELYPLRNFPGIFSERKFYNPATSGRLKKGCFYTRIKTPAEIFLMIWKDRNDECKDLGGRGCGADQ